MHPAAERSFKKQIPALWKEPVCSYFGIREKSGKDHPKPIFKIIAEIIIESRRLIILPGDDEI